MATSSKLVGDKNKNKISLSFDPIDRLRFASKVQKATVIGIISKEEHAAPHALKLNKMGFHVLLLGGTVVSIPPSVEVIILRTASCSHNASNAAYEFARNGGKIIVENGMSGIIRKLSDFGITAQSSGQNSDQDFSVQDFDSLSDQEVMQELFRLVGFTSLKLLPNLKGSLLVKQAELHYLKNKNSANARTSLEYFSALFKLIADSSSESPYNYQQALDSAARKLDLLMERIRKITLPKVMSIISHFSDHYQSAESVSIYMNPRNSQSDQDQSILNLKALRLHSAVEQFIVSVLGSASSLLRVIMTPEEVESIPEKVQTAFANSAHPIISAALRHNTEQAVVVEAEESKNEVPPMNAPAALTTELPVALTNELPAELPEPVIQPVTASSNNFDNFNAALQLLKTEMQALGITMLKLNGPDLTEVTYARTFKSAGKLSF